MTKKNSSKLDISTSDKRLIDLLNRYFGSKVIIAALSVMFIGTALILISFGKATVNWHFFILLEIGKALMITALITLPVRWFLIKQSEEIAKEKNEIIIKNIYQHFEKLKSKVEISFNNLDDKMISTIGKHNEALSSHDRCIQDEIKCIKHSSASLIALSDVHTSRVYDSRNEASEDILNAI